jgi:hypothetical protein
MLPGGAGEGIDAVSKLNQGYPKARLAFCGFSVGNKNLIMKFADLGGDPARINVVPQSRTTFEDALYLVALLEQNPAKGGCWSPQPCICRVRSDASGCRISGGALSDRVYDPRPIGFIRQVRYWLFQR